MNAVKKGAYKKHIFYTLTLLFFYILSTVPGFLEIGDIKPMLVYPAVTAIALLEGSFSGALYGLWGGLLCDSSGYSLFGFNTVILFILCIFIGQFTHSLTLPSLPLFLFAHALTLGISLTINFIFTYSLWRIEGLESLFMDKVVWTLVFTAVVSPLFFFLYRFIYKRYPEEEY